MNLSIVHPSLGPIVTGISIKLVDNGVDPGRLRLCFLDLAGWYFLLVRKSKLSKIQ